MIFRKIVLVFVFLLMNLESFCQDATIDSTFVANKKTYNFNYKQLIIPTVLIGYGIVGLESDDLKLFNNEISEEVNEHIDEKVTIDDFAQYAPVASIFVLDFAGVKGKHTLKDKLIIATTSHLIMGITVETLKKTTKVERPDKTSFNSFPSGHTATAFAGAELLYQEYKDVSIWFGISGYVVASGVGAFRMYNNRHWFTDVVAGAGIGILSTKAAYWLYPTINKLFNSNSSTKKTAFIPFYDGKTAGFGLVSNF
jgi:hypothetical protein